MGVPICEYIKIGGERCGSPALRDFKFCFYHVRLHEAMPMTTMFVEENPNVPPGEIPISAFQVPFLDEAAAIQVGYMQLIHGVSHHRLNPRQAGLVLSALHGAAANLRRMEKTQELVQAALKRCEPSTASEKATPQVKPAETEKKKPTSVRSGEKKVGKSA